MVPGHIEARSPNNEDKKILMTGTRASSGWKLIWLLLRQATLERKIRQELNLDECVFRR
jgi:hypothetical protein